jgi:hypothetical protein
MPAAKNALSMLSYRVMSSFASPNSEMRSSLAYPSRMSATCASTATTTAPPISRCQRASRSPPTHRSSAGTRLISSTCTSST